MSNDINPTPEELIQALQGSLADVFDRHGATLEVVGQLTAKALKAKKTREITVVDEDGAVRTKIKTEPDWAVVTPAIERVIRANAAYPAEKKDIQPQRVIVEWQQPPAPEKK